MGCYSTQLQIVVSSRIYGPNVTTYSDFLQQSKASRFLVKKLKIQLLAPILKKKVWLTCLQPPRISSVCSAWRAKTTSVPLCSLKYLMQSLYSTHSAYCLVINKSYSCDLKHKAYLTRPDYCCFFFSSRNGMQLNVSGEHKSVDSEGVKSLHCELILAQSAEVGNYH